MRAFVITLAAMFALVGSAAAQTVEPAQAQVAPPEASQDAPLAKVIVNVLAPVTYGSRPYDWDAVSIRISRYMHWHLAPPDTQARPQGGLYQRNGWVEGGRRTTRITAWGDAERVRTLDFDLRTTIINDRGDDAPEALAAALRAAGATVEKRDSPNVFAAYTLTVPGKRSAMLSITRRCTNPNAAAMPRCDIEGALTLLEEG